MMTSRKNIVVLQPTLLNKPVQLKLREIFDVPIVHKVVSETVVTDFTDESQLQAVFSEVRNKVMEMLRGVEEEDDLDVYVISSGGVFHSAVLIDMLRRSDIRYKLLVYDTRVQRYVVVDPEQYFGEIGA